MPSLTKVGFMSNQERALWRMRELCGELGPEDGIDPREFKRRREGESRQEGKQKTLRLCGQIARSIELCLGTATDTLLVQLVVDTVEPAPDASRLRVVMTCDPRAGIDPDEALARLRRASGWLRSEVAASIHRKKTPVLMFGWRPSQ